MPVIRDIAIVALTGAFALSMVAAALIDARSRRFPNRLAALMALLAAVLSWALHPASLFIVNALISAVLLVALFAFEVIWRRAVGRTGLGMGDAKALSILALVSPSLALCSFCIAMVLLAALCVVRKRESMPLLPLLMPVFAALALASWVVWPGLDGVMGI